MKRDKILPAVLLVLLVASFVVNIVQFYTARDKAENIVGTYQAGQPPMGGNEYLVFTQEGTYMRYRQLEPPLDEGRYTQVNEGGVIYELQSDGGGKTEVLLKDDVVYRFEDGTIFEYGRIGDIPIYISLPGTAAEGGDED